jgi:hypothetical protein
VGLVFASYCWLLKFQTSEAQGNFCLLCSSFPWASYVFRLGSLELYFGKRDYKLIFKMPFFLHTILILKKKALLWYYLTVCMYTSSRIEFESLYVYYGI